MATRARDRLDRVARCRFDSRSPRPKSGARRGPLDIAVVVAVFVRLSRYRCSEVRARGRAHAQARHALRMGHSEPLVLQRRLRRRRPRRRSNPRRQHPALYVRIATDERGQGSVRAGRRPRDPAPPGHVLRMAPRRSAPALVLARPCPRRRCGPHHDPAERYRSGRWRHPSWADARRSRVRLRPLDRLYRCSFAAPRRRARRALRTRLERVRYIDHGDRGGRSTRPCLRDNRHHTRRGLGVACATTQPSTRRLPLFVALHHPRSRHRRAGRALPRRA